MVGLWQSPVMIQAQMVTTAKDLTLCRGRSVFFHHNSVKTYADF